MKKNNKKNAKKFNQQHPFTQKEQHKNVDFIVKINIKSQYVAVT